ncbi:hypothetical protein L218DRAFT_957795 [Marasmius fiardii PR-910]|nr:hypothetical protein L218DRAFT_957795 [Marasmius fiardii PR-910]
MDLIIMANVGKSYVLTSAGLITAAVLYGICIGLLFAAIGIMCRREGFSRARMILLAAIVVLFSLSTVHITASFSYFVIGIKMLLVENPATIPLKTKSAAYLAKFHRLGIVGQVTFPVSCVVGDAIVIWRAWTLSGGDKKVMFLPIVLLLGLTASCFSFVGCMVEEDLPVVPSDSCTKRNLATFILSVITNVAGAAVLGYQVWIYRRTVKKYLQHGRRQLLVEKILVLLLESGAIYITIWTIQIAEFIFPARKTTSDQEFRQVFYVIIVQLVGIYPTSLVVLVSLQRSLWDSAGKSTICDDISDIQFSRSRGMESNSSHSVHDHDLMHNKPKPDRSSEEVLYQEKHDDSDNRGVRVSS